MNNELCLTMIGLSAVRLKEKVCLSNIASTVLQWQKILGFAVLRDNLPNRMQPKLFYPLRQVIPVE